MKKCMMFWLLLGLVCTLDAQTVDWDHAQVLRPGVLLWKFDWELKRDKPLTPEQLEKKRGEARKAGADQAVIANIKPDVRPVKINVMRVDLAMGIGFTGMQRAPGWGEPMPDAPNQKIRLLRTKTEDFMKQCRRSVKEGGRGLDMIVATNAGSWAPWPPPKGNIHASPNGITVADGITLTDNPGWRSLFIVYKNGKIEITNNLPPYPNAPEDKKYQHVAFASSGFGLVRKDGQNLPCVPKSYEAILMPRMIFALDKAQRFLFLITTDGRMPGRCEGATCPDLYPLFDALGAYDVIDMDGGGSATLSYWNPKTNAPVTVNQHGYKSVNPRAVGVNMGIYLLKQ